MAKFDVLDMNGKKVSTVELSDAVFGITPNEKAVHAAVVNFLVHKVRGRAGDLRAVGEHRFMHIVAVHAHAAEGRNKRRMNVDDPVRERAHNLRAHDGR